MDLLEKFERETKAWKEEHLEMVKSEKEKMLRKFDAYDVTLRTSLNELQAQEEMHRETFTYKMKEAFDAFKESTESEQTKRMRQIGDFMVN